MQKSQRLISLDVLRGLTVMLMIFVNNGAGDLVFTTLRHSRWNGMTPCDLVFPTFLFIMGVSTYLSLKKQDFQWSRPLVFKIVKRTLLLFLIGLFINWYHDFCYKGTIGLDSLRIMGVMQRIALCYFFTALFALCSKSAGSLKAIPVCTAILLILYSILILTGGGYTYDSSTNLLSVVDRHVLGEAHLYHKSPVDPEGLLSTLSAVAQTMIGFWCGKLMSEAQTIQDKMLRLLLAAVILTLLGWLLTFAMPLNKRIWSPSYVLTTCGYALSLWALLIYALDYRHVSSRRLTDLCLIYGTNPLFLYVLSELIGIAFNNSGVKMQVYGTLLAVIPNGYWASVAYSLLFTSMHALLGYPLWKRRIFIKL